MKKIVILLLSVCALLPVSVSGQARRVPPATAGAPSSSGVPADGRSASQLYDDASGYAARKFREFSEKKVPFDPNLMEQTLKEQKELAARHAAVLYARPNLQAEDLYYMGLLYNISANEERTVETFRRFLEGRKDEGGERPQHARYVLAHRLAQTGRAQEAEAPLADYMRLEPRKQTEVVAMESALARGYRKEKKLERAAAHAEAAFTTAKEFQPKAQNDVGDKVLAGSSLLLVEIYREMKKPAPAVTGVLEEVRKLAQGQTSARLYTDATVKLADVLVDAGRKAEAVKLIEDATAYARTGLKDDRARPGMLAAFDRKRRQLRLQGEAAPEITIAKWIEQAPVKLADLRGRVVLLDFWATWCGPCVASFPHLKELHEKYKDRGLVILGVTKYYGGRGTARNMTKDEELTYIEQFKKQYGLPYGVAVTETDDNHLSYGVSAIPTTVLIDRKGVVRLMATGIGGGNEAEISDAIERLVEEK